MSAREKWIASLETLDEYRRSERRRHFEIGARISTIEAEIAERQAFAVMLREEPMWAAGAPR